MNSNIDDVTFQNVENLRFCPACGTTAQSKNSNAVISPWVLELAGLHIPELTQYSICKSCGSGWFTKRYSIEVLDALYSAYRGDKYFKIRNSWEPSYSEALNNGLNHGQKWLESRRTQIEDSLSAAGVQVKNLKSVLDFGGGHGGVMPLLERRYLLEANEKTEHEEDIVLVKSIREAKNLELDLVMCCGVLEHVNDPANLISEILEINARYYLFEVPTGTPQFRRGIGNSKKFTTLVSSKKSLWRILQMLERKVSKKMRTLFPLRCSEHLQFFSTDGLKSLLEGQNLQILEIGVTSPNTNLDGSFALGFEQGLIAICQRPAEGL